MFSLAGTLIRVTLNEFTASTRLAILDELERGHAPSTGRFSAAALEEARRREDRPQLGAARYAPRSIVLEFIFPGRQEAALVFTVEIEAPERIVYLAVPGWVVQTIWQGEISGSYHFESDAYRLLGSFSAGIEPEANRAHFGEDPGTGAARS